MREVGGIIMPDRYWQRTTEGLGFFATGTAFDTQFMEIVDIGEDCELWKLEHTRWDREIFDDGEYGVTVFCPVLPHAELELIDEDLGFVIAKSENVVLPVIVEEGDVWTPIADYLVVELDRDEDAGGGIVKAEAYTYESWQGVVVKAGPDVREVAVGMRVIIASDLSVHKFGVAGKVYGCPGEGQILAVVG